MLQEAFPQSAVSRTSLSAPSLFAGKGAPTPGWADGHEHPTSIVYLIDLGGGGLQCLRFTDFLDIAMEGLFFFNLEVKNCEFTLLQNK